MYSLFVIFQERTGMNAGQYTGELRIKGCATREQAYNDLTSWSACMPASLDKFIVESGYQVAFAEVRDPDGRPLVF